MATFGFISFTEKDDLDRQASIIPIQGGLKYYFDNSFSGFYAGVELGLNVVKVKWDGGPFEMVVLTAIQSLDSLLRSVIICLTSIFHCATSLSMTSTISVSVLLMFLTKSNLIIRTGRLNEQPVPDK